MRISSPPSSLPPAPAARARPAAARWHGGSCLLSAARFALALGLAGGHHAQAGDSGGMRPITSHTGYWDARRSVDADRSHPVTLEFVVAYYDPVWHLLWIEHDGGVSFLPVARMRLPMHSRQRVRVAGEVVPAEGLHAEKLRVTVLADEVPPRATPGNGRLLDLVRRRQSPVAVTGYVERQEESDANHLVLDLVVDDRRVRGTLWLDDGAPVPAYGGQLVRAVGVCTIPSDTLSDTADLQLWIAQAGDIELADGPRVAELFALPETAIEQLATTAIGERVRLAGRVSARDPGRTLTVRVATGELELQTPLGSEYSPGEEIEVVGYPVQRAAGWTLRDVICRPRREPAAAAGAPAEVAEGLPKLRLAGQALHMTTDEAARGYPVELNGVVTFSHPIFTVLFLQDKSGGLCVNYEGTNAARPAAGEMVTVRGRTVVGGYATMVRASGITINGRGALPEPRPVTLEHALTGVEDAQWVEMRGFLRHIDMRSGLAYMTVVAAGGEFIMRVPATEPPPITLGSVLRASGVCASKPNEKRQLISVDLLVPSLDRVIIDDAAPADPFSRPLREIASLRRYQPVQTLDRQVRIHGTVLHHVPGRSLLVQGEGEVLRVLSRETMPLAPGDFVDVVGVPGRIAAQLVLREAVYRRTGRGDEPEPLALPDNASVDPGLDGRLVRLQGTLLDVAAHADETRLFVQTGATISEVVFEQALHPTAAANWSPGAKIELTGVYRVQYDEYDQPQGFNVQLRAVADVAILARPSWWTARRALLIAGLFFGLHLVGLVWAGTLRRRVREQTKVIRTQLENEASLEARGIL